MSQSNFPQTLIPALQQKQLKSNPHLIFEKKSNLPAVPIVQQPQNGPDKKNTNISLVNIPLVIENCPTGLEYLASIDQLLLVQQKSCAGFETNNKFKIKNTLGQDIFYAAEDTDFCTRQICCSARPFNMKIMDNYKNEVIHLYRPIAWCLSSIKISAPAGNVIGCIEKSWSLCPRLFLVKNHNNETILRIEGPFCVWSCCSDIDFSILTPNGDQVGKITKQWSGLAREMFTIANHFSISFPIDLDVRMKAVLLGACMLIDMLFYEPDF